jgi:3-oxoacyl-[acyl-carrier protein] reductase
MSDLTDKVALVTGSSRGIGAAIAKRLAGDGARVAFTYASNDEAARAVVNEIEGQGGKSIAIRADALSDEAVRSAVDETVAAFGLLDIFVNNAGTAIGGSFEDMTIEKLDLLTNLNVRGAFVATQAALTRMNDGGHIIMIGSALGERVVNPGAVVYSATKGAVKIFAQALSRELGGRNITVNNVQPGSIDTDLNPATSEHAPSQSVHTALGRYGHVGEIASMVAYLAGPESSYITGANLTVDGGLNA